MNNGKVKIGSLKKYKSPLSIDGLKKNVEECKDKVHAAEAILCFEMSQQGVRGYCRERLKQAQYNLDGTKINLRKAQEIYEFELKNLLDDKVGLIRYAQSNVSPTLVMIEEQENGKTLITIGGKYYYHFTRKTCIAIVKELQDGEWHNMIKKPTPNFRNAEKTTTRIKKSPHGKTTEEMTTEGDHYKFSENHLLSGGERKWRIVLHKSEKH